MIGQSADTTANTAAQSMCWAQLTTSRHSNPYCSELNTTTPHPYMPHLSIQACCRCFDRSIPPKTLVQASPTQHQLLSSLQALQRPQQSTYQPTNDHSFNSFNSSQLLMDSSSAATVAAHTTSPAARHMTALLWLVALAVLHPHSLCGQHPAQAGAGRHSTHPHVGHRPTNPPTRTLLHTLPVDLVGPL